MRTIDFDYELPADLIAQHAVEPRDASRLLVLPGAGPVQHLHFRDIGSLLRPDDVLVLNDTRVIAARLLGRFGDSGGPVEALLLRRLDGSRWEAMVRPARRFRTGRSIDFAGMIAEVDEPPRDGIAVLRFLAEGIDPTIAGMLPLPPYIREQPGDPERYQTVYARVAGSAAAPTAGLHFTPELLGDLRDQGVQIAFITLHVGPGTFRPVTVEDPARHHMHEEWFSVGDDAATAIAVARANGGRVVAAGTTVVRTLEQVASSSPDGSVTACSGSTRLLILPGYRFRAIDCMVTNFHLPRSTLLMLVAAFAGRERVLRAYAEAVGLGYRFYSFGDAMFVERHKGASG